MDRRPFLVFQFFLVPRYKTNVQLCQMCPTFAVLAVVQKKKKNKHCGPLCDLVPMTSHPSPNCPLYSFPSFVIESAVGGDGDIFGRLQCAVSLVATRGGKGTLFVRGIIGMVSNSLGSGGIF